MAGFLSLRASRPETAAPAGKDGTMLQRTEEDPDEAV